MVTLSIYFLTIISVHTCVSILIQVQILLYLLATSITWKYAKDETKDLGITFNTNLYWDQHYKIYNITGLQLSLLTEASI